MGHVSFNVHGGDVHQKKKKVVSEAEVVSFWLKNKYTQNKYINQYLLYLYALKVCYNAQMN